MHACAHVRLSSKREMLKFSALSAARITLSSSAVDRPRVVESDARVFSSSVARLVASHREMVDASFPYICPTEASESPSRVVSGAASVLSR